MTSLAAFVLSALLSAPAPWQSDEPAEQRRERVELVAASLAAALDVRTMTGQIPGTERRLWAAAAAATAIRESGGLNRRVHSGERLGDRGRSICYMQINRGNPRAFERFGWQALGGLDELSTARCATAGVDSLVRLRAWCARRVPRSALLAATLSAYTTGTRCEVTPEGKRRAVLARRLLRASGRRQGEDDPSLLITARAELVADQYDGVELRGIAFVDLERRAH